MKKRHKLMRDLSLILMNRRDNNIDKNGGLFAVNLINAGIN
jgi:hypothetical protein